jgi:hypothetical protein
MPRKVNLEKVQASLDAVSPKCGKAISPAEVRRVDFERIECPACGACGDNSYENPLMQWRHVLNAMLVVASNGNAYIMACDAAWRPTVNSFTGNDKLSLSRCFATAYEPEIYGRRDDQGQNHGNNDPSYYRDGKWLKHL